MITRANMEDDLDFFVLPWIHQKQHFEFDLILLEPLSC